MSNYLWQILSQRGIDIKTWLNLDDEQVAEILAISLQEFTADLARTIEAIRS